MMLPIERRRKAQVLQKAGKGMAGAGQMIEFATDLLEEPRLLDLADDSPGPIGLGILSRVRQRFRRQR